MKENGKMTVFVKIIQLFYDDNYEEYQLIKEEEITKIVSI